MITLSARRPCGSPMPGWLRFDSLGQRFHGTPEEFFAEELVIEVVATDNDGVAVSGTFVIRRCRSTG